MWRLVTKSTLAVFGASVLYQFGAILPSAPVAAADQRVFVSAPDPAAWPPVREASPPGLVVTHMSRAQLPKGDYNHVRALSSAQLANLGGRTGIREVSSQDGHFSGVVSTAKGAYRITLADGVLASGRQVIAFGADLVGGSAAPVRPQQQGLILNAEAATRRMLRCSYETVDPATNNLFLYVCPADVVPMEGLLLVFFTVVGAIIGFIAGNVVGALIGALVGAALSAAVILGLWRITNLDGSITLTIPAVVWQNLSGWFYYGTGQYVWVNGNPCQVYYENIGWVQGCQLSDTFNWVGVNFDGRLEAFVIGGGNNMYSIAQQCNPNCAWTGWMGHGGSLIGRPTIGGDVNGELNALAVGSGSYLKEAYQAAGPGGGWSGWYNLGCCFTGHVGVGRNADGRLEAVVRNGNGNIDHFWETSQSGSWNGYAHLMCCFASSPTIESNTDGRLEVFAIDNYQNLYHIWQVTPNGGWSGIQNLGCCLIGNPQAGRFADGSLVVFGIGTDHNLYYKRQSSPGGGWGGWVGLGGGGNLVSDPVVRQNVDGRLEAFVIDSNSHLRDVWENSPNGTWSWGDLGCCVKGNPDVQININGILEVFAVGMDNALYHKWQSAPGQGPWSSWSYLGGVITVTP